MNIEYTCPNCESVIVQGLNYCTSCGLELTENQTPGKNPNELDHRDQHPHKNLDIETILNMHEGTSKNNKDRPFYTKKRYIILIVLMVIGINYCSQGEEGEIQQKTKSTIALHFQHDTTVSEKTETKP